MSNRPAPRSARRASRSRTGRRAHASSAGPARTPFVARSEADLAAMVPLALGFHPTESVVVMTFGPAAFHARVDLPSAAALRDGAGEEVAHLLAHACVRNAARVAAVLVFSDDHLRARRQGEQVLHALHDAGLDVVDVLRVHAGRWFEPLRDDEVGTAYQLDSHPFTVRGVYEGVAVHGDRAALAATLVGSERERLGRDELARACASRGWLLAGAVDEELLRTEARWVRERVRRAVAQVRAGGDPGVDLPDAARLLVAVRRGDLRDAAWIDLTRDHAEAHVPLWRDLVRRAPAELVPSVAGLLAMAAYRSGDGALAWCAIDRAIATEPDHTLVRLVADALTAAVPPSAWPEPSTEAMPLLRGHG